MLRNSALFALALVLSGCATQVLQGYVGKSVTEPMLDHGRPSNVFDLPDGTRAFQWKKNSYGAIPITTPTTSNIYGPGGWATVTTTSTSYAPYSNQCTYTLIAQPSGKDWVVVSYREPSLECL